MKDRAEYAQKGIARGRALVAVAYGDGILIVAENPSRTLHKVSEIYDRVAFAGVGKYNEFDQLRVAGIRMPTRRATPTPGRTSTRRSLANLYAQYLGQVFTHEMKPLEVEILVAELCADRRPPALPHRLRRHGRRRGELDRPRRRGRGDRRPARARPSQRIGPSATALKSCVACLAGPDRTLGIDDLEVGVLEKSAGRRAFRRVDGRAQRPPGLSGSPTTVPTATAADVGRPVARRREARSRYRAGDGPAHLRNRERVRRHLHAPRSASAHPRRGRALPVPPRGDLGPVLQRLLGERGAALPRRRQPPGVRDARVRLRSMTSSRTTRRGSASSRVCSTRPRRACAKRASAAIVYLFKNNTDSAGNSYGCHENYLTGRRRRLRPLRRGADPVPRHAPDLRRRGQGPADARGAVYCISASAPSTSGRASPRPRPGPARSSTPATNRTPTPRRYRRLHVIVGDSNMSEYATFLKIGATSSCCGCSRTRDVVLRDMTLEDPIRAIREISHDITCRRRVRLANGREVSALDIQSEYLGRAVALRRPARPAADGDARPRDVAARVEAIERDPLLLDASATGSSSTTCRALPGETRARARQSPRRAVRSAVPRHQPATQASSTACTIAGALERRHRRRDREAKDAPPPDHPGPPARRVHPRAKERRRDFTVDWVHLKLNDQTQRTVL